MARRSDAPALDLSVRLHYLAGPGEFLVWVSGSRRVEMTPDPDGWWTASVRVPESGSLEYGFEVVSGGKTIRREWRSRRVAWPAGVSFLRIWDRWQEMPADAILYLPWFSRVQNGLDSPGRRRVQRRAKCVPGLLFEAMTPPLGKDECLGVTGSLPKLGGWTEALPMKRGEHGWHLSVSLPESVSEPMAYKYVLLDSRTGRIKTWEAGDNHTVAALDLPSGQKADSLLLLRDAPRFERPLWRAAGLAIPVFSLRSEQDFGVGEFADLRLLADWAADCGMRVIQLLPVHDTTVTGSWRDSYPYSATSAFALHPMYLRLEDCGVRPDARSEALRRELNALPAVDYERVNRFKLRLLRAFFERRFSPDDVQALATALLEGILPEEASLQEMAVFASEQRVWLLTYAVFCTLRDRYGTADSAQWGRDARCSPERLHELVREHPSEVVFHVFLQFHLDRQLRAAAEYARSKGVLLKGDLPIGVGRHGADTWEHPGLFHLDACAGAPPDFFSADGQNWGFPTYDWEAMAAEGYLWWRRRMHHMSRFFDAYRIDHILGFFRIWEIPAGVRSGLFGRFHPALPYCTEELHAEGFTLPDGDALFLEDLRQKGRWHPAIGAKQTAAYEALGPSLRERFDRLYEDFFFHRHNSFWAEGARRKLSALLGASPMLACGEDLGMIPACVPEVMHEMSILSLEIQRMPKELGVPLANPLRYPYASVCATGTHDTETLRSWLAARSGQADASPQECLDFLRDNLLAPSVLAIFPLQDWLSVDATLRYDGNPADERINDPGNPDQYWHWRMHLTLEDLLARKDFSARLVALLRASGRLNRVPGFVNSKD